MPLIRLSVSQKLTQDKQEALLNGLGEAISNIPGKLGSTLIVDLEDGKTMYFGGEIQEDMVFADVQYLARYEYHKKKDFTVAAFNAINKALGTSKDRMVLTITELENWGGFGDFQDLYYS